MALPTGPGPDLLERGASVNPSTALATVLVDELIRCGVREFVLAPGSRSAPLAYAVQAAGRAGHLRLHVRVDERSAGFLALGLAKISRRPAVVITTSGTAVANLHPAVLEAHHGSVPMIVLSADRPEELRATGANQTTVQPGIFGGALRWEHDLPAPCVAGSSGVHAPWRTRVDRAWAAATGAGTGSPGPVHLNVGFRDPLTPEFSSGAESAVDGHHRWELPEGWAGRADGQPWTQVMARERTRTGAMVDERASGAFDVVSGAAAGSLTACVDESRAGGRTLMLLGDLPEPDQTAQALAVAARCGWPVVAEPFGTGDRSMVLPHGSLVLTATDWVVAHGPHHVVVVGRCTLNREAGALLRRPGLTVEAVTPHGAWTDPSHIVRWVSDWDSFVRGSGAQSSSGAQSGSGTQDTAWVEAWQCAGAAVAEAVEPLLGNSWPSGPAVAQRILRSLDDDDLLVLGSSNAARSVERAGVCGRRLLVTGNRGLAGIDGTNASAVGIALAAPERRVVALMGDLTFLHDTNGLLIGPDEPRPDLTIVVVNDDGGGIFTALEYGEPQRAGDFERIFGTPTGADLRALCAAYAVRFERVQRPDALEAALSRPADGIRVLEVAVPRAGHRELSEALTRAARVALRALA